MDVKEQIAYNERKLAHYNQWLLDTKREFGKPYPGFPEDNQPAKKAKKTAAAKPAAKKVVKRAAKTGTKLELARQLYAANWKQGRERVIALFMSELNMSKAGATTYFYNAKK